MKLLKCECNDGVLTLVTPDRIETLNAGEVGEDVDEALALPHTSVVVDADPLAYISSAGLRVILKLRKAEPELRIVNVNSDVYEIFEMTGFTEMITVEKAFRRLSVDGCPVIGRGAKGTVYRYNADTVVKVYKSRDSLPAIRNERELARRAFVLGIPTAISYDVVKVGDLYGSVFELLDADSFSAMIAKDPANMIPCVNAYADLLRQLHATAVKKEDMPDVKPFILDWCDKASPFLAPEKAAKLRALITETPDTDNMLHCDYHTNNLMMQNGETVLIDMDSLCHGHPVFELANIYITYVGFGETDPDFVANFIGLPYPKCVEFWNLFLRRYLGTDDEARLRYVEDRARLLAYARYIRHVARRGADDEKSKTTIAYCKEKAEALLDTIDALAF